MSRAFLKEDDGWRTCREKGRECILAEDDGSCSIGRCKYESGGQTKKAAVPDEP